MIFAGVFGFTGIPRVMLHFGGEQVTAHVDECHEETRRGRRGRTYTVTVCTGTWQTGDGQQHSGEIEGAEAEHNGQDITVRTNGDEAQVDDITHLWPAGCFLLIPIGGWALSRRSSSGPSDPPPGYGPPPGYPPPPPRGYPPQQAPSGWR